MKQLKTVLAALVVAVAAGLPLAAQTPHTVYIDASSNNGPANWNNLAFNAHGASLALKDSLTNATGIRATVSVRLNGANTNGSTSPTGDAAEFAPAGSNSSYGHTTVWSGVQPILYGEVTFSNLNPAVAYDFTFFASRMSVADVRDARYTVTGSNSVSVVLDASNNSSHVATPGGVYTDPAGVATLRIEPGPGNNNANGFYYLTAVKLAYAEPPPTVVYVDAAGSSTAAGWNLLRFAVQSDAFLADTNGAPTGIRALVAAPLGNENTWGALTLTESAADFQPAGGEASYASGAAIATLRLFHLKPSVPYTFTFFGSRKDGTPTRQTFYKVFGANAGSNNLETASNTQSVAVVADILPAADGTITVNVSRGLTNSQDFIYLNAFKISYVDNSLASPPTAVFAGKRLLFFGNQYLSTESVPAYVAGLAQAGGYPRPYAVADLANDRTLASQIARVAGSPGFNVDYPGLDGTNQWDLVVMQGHGSESSSLGDVEAFRTNALALYQKVKAHASGKGAAARALLLQTWARGAGSDVYPASFADPAAMQAEINANTAAATGVIAAAEGAASVLLAPAGDAFATGGYDPSMLYAADLSTPGKAGPELAALVLYKTIYGETATNLSYDAANAAGLTGISEGDWIRVTHWAEGLAAPEPQEPAAGAPRVILLDTCSNAAGSPVYLGWNYKSFTTTGVVENLVLSNGYPTAVSCEVLTRMTGTSASSAAAPTGDAALFARALANNAFGNVNPWVSNTYSSEYCVVRFSGLNPMAAQAVTCYASRTGATGRETLYVVEGATSGSALLEPGNNSSEVAVLPRIRPRPDGTLDLKITAGPNNTSAEKFYHINALMLESSNAGLLITVQ
jgi:hypothetical protein